MVTADDVVASARKLLGVWYEWWEEGEPIPLWYYDYPGSVPPRWWFNANGTMCSDLINYARMDNGLEYIGGTPAYYDWLYATGEWFDSSAAGVPGALCVNPGVWRGGEGQGHISLYTDERTLIQATDGTGDFAGVNEGEQDYDSHRWANYWLYGLMPDVDYSAYLGEGAAPTPEDLAIQRPRWLSIDKDGWQRADGPDWARGWHQYNEDGSLGPWRGPAEA